MYNHSRGRRCASVFSWYFSVLRGTSPDAVLSRGGAELRTSPDKVAADWPWATKTFSKSRHVDHLDTFLSHSWRAPWLAKYFCLLFHFNSMAAVLAGILVMLSYPAVVVYFRGTFGENDQIVQLVAGWSVTLIVLVFWQDILAKLGLPTESIFFDKVCIHQADLDLKLAAISSIGGFIGNSKSLLVAWDSTYLLRLWCPFEITAFKYRNPTGKVIILPVEMGSTIAALAVAGIFRAVSGVVTTLLLDHWANGDDPTSEHHLWWLDPHDRFYQLERSIHYSIWMIPYIILAVKQQAHAAVLANLENQISQYSIRSAECYCCTHSHVHPLTGATLACDRSLVYASIGQWYGADGQFCSPTTFDQLVRDMCRHTIATDFTMSGIPYTSVLVVTIWHALTFFVYDETALSCWQIMNFVDTLLLREPMIIAFIVTASQPFLSVGQQAASLHLRVLRMLAPVCVGMTCQSIGVKASNAMMHQNWLYFLWMCAEVYVVWLLYFRKEESFFPSGAPAPTREIELRSNSDATHV